MENVLKVNVKGLRGKEGHIRKRTRLGYSATRSTLLGKHAHGGQEECVGVCVSKVMAFHPKVSSIT